MAKPLPIVSTILCLIFYFFFCSIQLLIFIMRNDLPWHIVNMKITSEFGNNVKSSYFLHSIWFDFNFWQIHEKPLESSKNWIPIHSQIPFRPLLLNVKSFRFGINRTIKTKYENESISIVTILSVLMYLLLKMPIAFGNERFYKNKMHQVDK